MLLGRRRQWVAVLTLLTAGCADGCSDDNSTVADGAAAAPMGLSPELANEVLAKVGDRTITLGDYAATLERMNKYERLRYQSPDRRKLLLDEIIRAELLAQEARRRKLDEKPETVERLRQLLRDELLRRVRAEVPEPSALDEKEVRAYYAQHRQEFADPARRRISHIEVSSRNTAEKVLERAQKASPQEWGALVKQYSLDKRRADDPAELLGDLGIVTAPGVRDDEAEVAAPLRKAAFAIEKPGHVYPQVVEVGSRYHIVRLINAMPARERSFAEAERTVRVALVQKKIRDAEEALLKKLTQRYPIQVDDDALAKVKVPDAAGGP